MTPYQRAAFLYPCRTPGDFNRPGKGPPTPPAEAQGNPQAVAPVHHHERGFRVSMIVDAVPESAGRAEGWPAWHVTVVLDGAERVKHRADRGKPHVERALGSWGALREKAALHIVRRELRGVGDPGSLVIVDKAQAMRLWATSAEDVGMGAVSNRPVAVYGRCKLTLEEACRCLGAQDDLDVQRMLDPVGRVLLADKLSGFFGLKRKITKEDHGHGDLS